MIPSSTLRITDILISLNYKLMHTIDDPQSFTLKNITRTEEGCEAYGLFLISFVTFKICCLTHSCYVIFVIN
jgi:hypothetical protein